MSWTTVPVQWGLTNTAWPQAVADYCAGIFTLKAPVTVAVIDSGLNAANQGFPPGMVLPGQTFMNGLQSAGSPDQNGHGTFVAGLIGAAPYGPSPPQGIYGAYIDPTGLGHALSLLPVRVLDQCGQGTLGDLAAALIWAVNNGALVVNMSMESSQDSAALEAAVNAASKAGVVLVAAAGNSHAPAGFPAGYAPVLSVAALDHAHNSARYSNYGKVDLSAPGGDDTDAQCNRGGPPHNDWCLAPAFNGSTLVDSCLWEVFSLSGSYPASFPATLCALLGQNNNYGCGYGSGYAAGSGTSFAAPLVAAAAAMLISEQPGIAAADVAQRLEQCASPTAWGEGWNSYVGWGELDFRQALDPSYAPPQSGKLTVWNYPNPFNPSRDAVTTFSVNLPASGAAALDVFDAAGQRVRHFDLSGPGVTHAAWDGRNGAGSLVANGGYRGVLTQGSLRSVAKVAVLQ